MAWGYNPPRRRRYVQTQVDDDGRAQRGGSFDSLGRSKADASKLATARKAAGLQGRDLDELAESLPADIKSVARAQRGGESGTGIYRPGRPRRGRALVAALDAEQTKVGRDRAARRGLLYMLARQRVEAGGPVGRKTWDRLGTRGTVGAPGDDDTQAAMAAYVQRKRASLAGGASATRGTTSRW